MATRDEQGTDVAQSSARGQHFYDMAAMKAVINREGQLREVKHNVKLVRDALAADPSTNVDTLMKGVCPVLAPRGAVSWLTPAVARVQSSWTRC